MKNSEPFLFPIYLLVVGIITLTGINLFGAAILEGAAWKQNVILALLLIFGMLPPSVKALKVTWMIAGYALAFFMFGGANIIGTVGIMLSLEKIMLAVLVLFTGYRLWAVTWQTNKLLMIIPILTVVCIVLLFPIQDQNIVGSGIDALTEWSSSAFTSDKGFHIYLGLTGIFSSVTEILILKNTTEPTASTSLVTAE